MKNLILKITRPLLPAVGLIALPIAFESGPAPDGAVVRLAAAGGQVGECRRAPDYICFSPYGDPHWIRERQEITKSEALAVQRQLGGTEDFGRVSFIKPIGGQRLLVGDELTDPHLFIVDLPEESIVARIGRHGEGPSEFISPGAIARDPINRDVWWVFDFGNARWTAIAVGDTPRIVEQISFAGVPVWPDMPIWLDDNDVLVHGIFYGFPFLKVKLDAPDRVIDSLRRFSGHQPFDERTIDHGTGLRFVNRNFMAVRPSRDLFVLAYQFGNQIDVFSTEGVIIGRTRGPYDVNAKFRIIGNRFHWDDDNQSGYVEAYGTQRFFYLRWSGRYLGDPLNTTTEIHQFSWNGRLLRTLELDQGVLAFAVSEADDRLWGYVEDPRSIILEWALPPTQADHGPPGS